MNQLESAPAPPGCRQRVYLGSMHVLKRGKAISPCIDHENTVTSGFALWGDHQGCSEQDAVEIARALGMRSPAQRDPGRLMVHLRH